MLIGLLILYGYSNCQEPPLQMQQQMEQLADDVESELLEDDQDQQYLDHLARHPLNLNKARAEDLLQTGLLTALQVGHFIRYRDLLGELIDLHELQAVPSWNIQTIRRILPYVIVKEDVLQADKLINRLNGEHQFLLRISRGLQQPKGFDHTLPNAYIGDPFHVMARYRYQYKNLLYIGWTGDKDAGESFLKTRRKGFDFNSFHFFATEAGAVKALAIGDYRVSLGQGLIQWQSMGYGKSAEVMMVKRQAPALQPYRSAGEVYFNRGAALTIQHKNWEGTLFYSDRKIDGNRNDSTGVVTSMITTGYHRNEPEINDRKSLPYKNIGWSIKYGRKGSHIALNGVHHQVGAPFEVKDDAYQLYQFSGQVLWNVSFDYSYTFRNIHVFGEAAMDPEGNKAFLNGLLMSVDARVDLSLLNREISPAYQSLNANAFTEGTRPENEQGWYLGLSVRPSGNWTVNAYADFFNFPWLRYRVHAPSAGREYLVQLQYQPSKIFNATLRYRFEEKDQNETAEEPVHHIINKTRQQLRFHFNAQLSGKVHLKSRVEAVWYEKGRVGEEQGFMSYLESGFQQGKWGGNARWQYFQTDGYNSRIYSFESNVLYNNLVPAVFHSGSRYYVNLNYRITKKIRAWFRWSQTIFEQALEQGSGLDAFYGKNRKDMSVQLMCLF